MKRATENAEGVIAIHRGIHGMSMAGETDLPPFRYDWRNPMLKIGVEELH